MKDADVLVCVMGYIHLQSVANMKIVALFLFVLACSSAPASAVPSTYSFYDEYAYCQPKSSVGHTATCAASGVYSVAIAASGRACRHEKKFVSTPSVQHILDCDENQLGCHGSDAFRTWSFARRVGIALEECYPTTLTDATCSHWPTNTCGSQQGMKVLLTKDVYYTHPGDTDAIKKEIVSYGPVAAQMAFYSSFLKYDNVNGIYMGPSAGEKNASHGHVVIYGWDTATVNGKTVSFWKVWAPFLLPAVGTGGQTNTGNVLFGVCGIESLVSAGKYKSMSTHTPQQLRYHSTYTSAREVSLLPRSDPSLLLESAMDSQLVDDVNAAHAGWSATEYPEFAGRSLDDVRRSLGGFDAKIPPVPPYVPTNGTGSMVTAVPFPESFDWRNVSFGGESCVHRVRKQGRCGSCWAHATTESLSDRFCIASNGAKYVTLSPEDVAGCDDLDHGCHGGSIAGAFLYMETKGNLDTSCLKYNASHVRCPKQGHCTGNGTWHKYFALEDSPVLFNGEAAMMAAILRNGPIPSAYIIYKDFMHYKSGVYVHLKGKKVGGHVVKLIGWGVDRSGSEPVKYWIVQNSFGKNWGMHGYFWIRRGTNECGIESSPGSALPRLNPL